MRDGLGALAQFSLSYALAYMRKKPLIVLRYRPAQPAKLWSAALYNPKRGRFIVAVGSGPSAKEAIHRMWRKATA